MFLGRLDLGVVMAFDIGVFVMPELMRDLPGLGLDQGRRQFKADLLIQLVEQRALGHLPRGARVFGAQPFADLAFQRLQVLGPELLGQLIVDLGGDGFLHLLDGAGENGRLAGQVFGPVFLGEGHLDLFLIALLDADQPLFEAGDERARPQFQREILGRAALEGLAIDAAHEIHHHLVALGGLALLGVEILGRSGKAFERLLKILIGRGDGHALKLERLVVDIGDLGQLFIAQRHDDIVAFFPVLVDHLHVGLCRRTVAGFLQVALHRAVDGLLHDLAHQPRAELLFEQRHRHLALAEPLHLDLGPCLFQLGIDAAFQVGPGDGDLVFALKALGQGFGDLHGSSHGGARGPVRAVRRLLRVGW